MPGPPRQSKALIDIAHEAGYHPGEFSLMRLAEDQAFVKQLRESLRVGRTPPEFGSMSPSEADALIRDLESEIEQRDLQWRSYFFPKLRDDTTTMQGPDGRDVQVNVNLKRPPDTD